MRKIHEGSATSRRSRGAVLLSRNSANAANARAAAVEDLREAAGTTIAETRRPWSGHRSHTQSGGGSRADPEPAPAAWSEPRRWLKNVVSAERGAIVRLSMSGQRHEQNSARRAVGQMTVTENFASIIDVPPACHVQS